MVQILLSILLLLLPAYAGAAYKVFLKNGSVITGVGSYEKRDGEVTVYFGGGSIGLPENDILKIEESEAPEKDLRMKGMPETTEEAPPVREPAADKGARIDALRAELDAINSELKAVEEQESSVTASINEKRGRRFRYNIYQLRQLEKEIEPLQQELFTIQQRKAELIQRKASIEGELRALQ